jgi:purine-binding chemotaxis protein CheW
VSSETATSAPAANAAASLGGKYLTFALGKEEYGLPILKVREIIGYMDVTAVPRTPPHIKGVVNLRGQVISVIDLRIKFGMEAVPRTDQTCIIVVEVVQQGRKFFCGVVVDRVSEVLNIPGDCIDEPPQLGASVQTDFIVGMAKIAESVKILLNLDRVMSAEDIAHGTNHDAATVAAAA